MKTKKFYIISLFLVIVGLGFLTAGLISSDFSPKKMMGIKEMAEQSYTYPKNFDRVCVNTESAEIAFTSGKTDQIEIDARFTEGAFPYIYETEVNGELVLMIELCDVTKRWYDGLFNPYGQVLEIMLPEDTEYDVELSALDGNIEALLGRTADLEVNSESGYVSLSNLEASGDLTVTSGHSAVELVASEIGGAIYMRCEGDVTMNTVDAGNIYINTVHGNAELKDVSSRSMIEVESMYGDVASEFCRFEEKLRLFTNSGSVKGVLPGDESDYSFYTYAAGEQNTLPTEREGDGPLVDVRTMDGNIRMKFENDPSFYETDNFPVTDPLEETMTEEETDIKEAPTTEPSERPTAEETDINEVPQTDLPTEAEDSFDEETDLDGKRENVFSRFEI